MFKFYKLIIFLLIFSFNSYASKKSFMSLIPKDNTLFLEHILTFLFSVLFLLCMGFFYIYKLGGTINPVIPDSKISFRNIFEYIGEFVYKQSSMILGLDKAKKYFSFLAPLFLIILFNNLLGLLPGLNPSTENLNTTFALGLVSFTFYNFAGMRSKGILNYLRHFVGPIWYLGFIMIPVEIISNFVRPLSLALRLRGNIFGDHLIFGLFSELVPFFIPVIFMFFGLLISIIQAYVFLMLTIVYIALAVSDEHESHA